ncbi:MAG: PHP domain-containing protein [Clostridia bacterium]|nr:PHP domain-containing protein [Clostridia bacterium]
MKFKFDHDYHIHSHLSLCSNDPEQSNERILQYAKENGLKKICLTDHFWDASVAGAPDWYKKQDMEHILQAKPLPESEGIEFLFGAETEFNRKHVVATAKETFDELDFVIIPTTHLHMRGLTITEEDYQSNDARGRIWVSRMDALLDQDLPFHKIGIAHLACPLFDNRSRQHYLDSLSLIPSDEMERVFAKAAEVGVGIELNFGDMKCTDDEADTVLRMFRIAKAQGCKFYCGSDAHHPKTLMQAKEVFERAIDRLELTENDKFHIGE